MLSGCTFTSTLHEADYVYPFDKEILPIKVTKQNQSKYNIDVEMSPTTFVQEGIEKVDNKILFVELKVPKKIDGKGIETIHISVYQKDSGANYLSTGIAFDKDFKDNTAVSTFFLINIEAINNAKNSAVLSVHYLYSDYFYLIDLKSYIDTINR